MSQTEHHTIFARRFRPQTFSEVLGQDPIVTTIRNALRSGRVAHAYLFSGSRGTGKTSLARLFAKALNCPSPREDMSPCNSCSSCCEITDSRSLDVIEIDGASHRGIDDIRMISDAVSYAPVRGRYKIYIIDEVHMLTKEAFNALLKTLEEPPPAVKFFFATTELHKLPQTIVSRCQRFNLKRFSPSTICAKLQLIADALAISVDPKAIAKIAHYADGGLRDAESLFDQVVAFSDGTISEATVQDLLGILPKQYFDAIDRAINTVSYNTAFEISDLIFSEGKEIGYFLQDLSLHYKLQLQTSASQFSPEELVHILDLIARAHVALKGAPSPRIILEWLLVSIIQIRYKTPLPVIVDKLLSLEKALSKMVVEPELQQETTQQQNCTERAAPAAPPMPAPCREAEPTRTAETQNLLENPLENSLAQEPAASIAAPQESRPITSETEGQERARQESLMNFAAAELEGILIKKSIRS